MNAPLLKRCLALLAGTSLAGCVAVGPDYRAPALETPAGWNRLDASVQPEMHPAAAGDLSRWWQSFNDPLLSELMEQALQASPDLRSARARLREARARRVAAGAGLFPSVNASVSASRSDSAAAVASGADAGAGASPGFSRSGPREFFSTGFDASWELDVFGGLRRGAEAAQADLESSQASLNDARVSLVAEVALNYIQARALQIRLDIARANLASQTETLQITAWRAQAGLVNSQDVEQARSNQQQTQAQIPSLEISLAEAEHSLDILLGKAPGTLRAYLAAHQGLPDLPSRIAVGIPADTLRQRPDVRAVERKLAAETARVGVAEAARYPSFTLSGSIGLEALTVGELGNSDARTASLLASITAPIFDAGRLRAQAEAQDAVRAQAEVAYQQAVLTALQDVENALVALSRSRARSDALARAAEAASNAAELARQRYSAGLIDFQSVLDTERSLLSIQDSLASARADSVLALIRLYKALGGGWSSQAEAGSVAQGTP